MNKSIGVIVSASSGTIEFEQKISLLKQAFTNYDLQPEFFLVHKGVNAKDVVSKALSLGHNIIVACGGDGTINAVASQLIGTEVVMGIIPFGTFNHLAQDLNIPLQTEEAVAVLLKGTEKRIDVAKVNGNLFLNNSSIGLYSKLVSYRTDHQQQGWSKKIALLRAMWDVFFNYSYLKVEIEVDGVKELHKTPFVFVGNNEYTVDGFSFGSREHMDSGKLCVYTIKHDSRTDLIKLGWHALFGKLTEHDQFNTYLSSEVILDTRKTNLRVAIDGEIISLPTPLYYSIRPKSLTVITND